MRAAWALLLASSLASKLPNSRVAATTSGGGAPSGQPEECAGSGTEPRMPHVTVGGEIATPEVSNTLEVDGRTIHFRDLHEELQLTYVHGIISPDEVDALVRMASARNGWARSPLKTQGTGASLNLQGTDKDDRRNSSSCPMIWPLVYAERRAELEGSAAGRHVLEELDLTTRLSARVAAMFAATGACAARPRAREP